jgi:hypothetical protein
MTHKETYPEQYTDPRIGKIAQLLDGRIVTIERFVPSRFGPLMIAEEIGPEEAFNQFFILE